MDSVEPHGEDKNCLPTEPSTSSSPPPYRPVRAIAGARIRYPSNRRHAADRNNEDHLTNQKKQRYWNSWEELYIVELWRRYRDEVTILNVPLPVYRKMMIAMRNRNMMVTAQDCRRKVNTLNTRYSQELKRVESTGGKSDWRLFPLLHCIMSPKVKKFDAWHETKVIRNLLDKLPKPVEVKPPSPPPPPPPPAPSPQIITPAPTPAPIIVTLNNQQYQFISHLNNTPQNFQSRPIPQHSMSLPKPSAVYAADTSSAPYKLPTNHVRFEKPSILPFRKITWEKLEQIRHDNRRLQVEHDETLERLQLEQKAFKCFEVYVRTWKKQMELELRKVKKLAKESTVKTENALNHNVEQQLQETNSTI